MKQRQTPELTDLEIPKQSDIPEDVVPLFGHDKEDERESSKIKLAYDLIMLALLVIDLLLIGLDNIMMSEFIIKFSQWLGFLPTVLSYQDNLHANIAALGGTFTLFWVAELSVRWLRAIVKRTYYRWFFFPFVHWYEVLGCFPALRALRLLRAGVIIKRLHDMGIKVIPENWLKSAQFYYHVVLEELSDRVILTAIDNFRAQLSHSKTHGELIQTTINKNRNELEAMVLQLLRTELAPKLQAAFLAQTGEQLSNDIGKAVEHALSDTPELRRYLKLIPIAGSLIENQITSVGKHIGENVTTAVNAHLFNPHTLDSLMVQIAKGVANINTDSQEIQSLVSTVINDALNAFEKQVKVQQWKHKEQLPI
ncbi:MAG: hypothetical protein Q4G13_09750 [Moraxella sp.]|nr:hypothetical protein [Moraxella sp.]